MNNIQIHPTLVTDENRALASWRIIEFVKLVRNPEVIVGITIDGNRLQCVQPGQGNHRHSKILLGNEDMTFASFTPAQIIDVLEEKPGARTLLISGFRYPGDLQIVTFTCTKHTLVHVNVPV